jgi:thioredoxin reductase (NADPH)
MHRWSYFLLGLVLMAWCYAFPPNYEVVAQESLADFSFQMDSAWGGSSNSQRLSDFYGKPIVVHLWSMTCPPCLDELQALDPVLNHVFSKDVIFLPICMDAYPGGQLRTFLMDKGWHSLPAMGNPKPAPRVRGVPTTLFLNRSGKIVGRALGPLEWDTKDVAQILERLGAETLPEKESAPQAWMDRFQSWIDALFSQAIGKMLFANAKELTKMTTNLQQSGKSKMEQRTDVLIIGSGPAGYSAAIYAARANLKPIVVTGMEAGGQLMITTDVENYPGFSKIQGPQLMDEMRKHAESVGSILVRDHIKSIDATKKPFVCTGESGQRYISDAIILATGAQARWLGIPSETAYRGFGVSGCATCDGFFFKGVPVAVVGGGNAAVEEALFLTNFATKVYLVHRRDSLRAEKVLQERLFKHPKIEVVWNHVVDEIVGKDNPKEVTGLKIKEVQSGATKTLQVSGVFIAIGHIPRTELVKGLLTLDADNYVVVKPGSTATSMPGIFAAGDVTDKVYRQAITSAGLGCMAALDVEKYLATQAHAGAASVQAQNR